MKQGLYREYRFRKDNIATVRGRIDLTSSMKNRISRRQLLTCEYDELSENNLLNQILKTTVMILLRHGEVKLEYKDELKKVMLFFVNVDLTDLRTVNWSSIRFYRYNKNYQMLIGLCQLLAEGMLMTTDTGENRPCVFCRRAKDEPGCLKNLSCNIIYRNVHRLQRLHHRFLGLWMMVSTHCCRRCTVTSCWPEIILS